MTETAQSAPAEAQTAARLEVADLHAWYGESHILHGANFHVGRGEVVPIVIPHAQFGLVLGVFGHKAVDHSGQGSTGIDGFVVAVNFGVGKESFAAGLADGAIIEVFRLPLDQHIADVKDHGLDLRHGLPLYGYFGLTVERRGRQGNRFFYQL